jgi:hypothetical protein
MPLERRSLMRLLAAALLVLVPVSGTAAPTPAGDMPLLNPSAGSPANCPPISRYEAARRGGKLPPSLLTELPTADLYKTVYRRIGGCEVPIIVRYNIGAPPDGAPRRR